MTKWLDRRWYDALHSTVEKIACRVRRSIVDQDAFISIVHDKYVFKNIFIELFQESICNSMFSYWGSWKNDSVHDLAHHTTPFTKFQFVLHNMFAPRHNVKSDSRSGKYGGRGGSLNKINSNLSPSIKCSGKNSSSSQMAPIAMLIGHQTAETRTAIVFTPIYNDANPQCAILTFPFGKEPSHYAMSRHSTPTLRDAFQHTWSQIPFRSETSAEKQEEFNPWTFRDEVRINIYDTTMNKRLKHASSLSTSKPPTNCQRGMSLKPLRQRYHRGIKTKGQKRDNLHAILPSIRWFRIIRDTKWLIYCFSCAEAKGLVASDEYELVKHSRWNCDTQTLTTTFNQTLPV